MWPWQLVAQLLAGCQVSLPVHCILHVPIFLHKAHSNAITCVTLSLSITIPCTAAIGQFVLNRPLPHKHSPVPLSVSAAPCFHSAAHWLCQYQKCADCSHQVSVHNTRSLMIAPGGASCDHLHRCDGHCQIMWRIDTEPGTQMSVTALPDDCMHPCMPPPLSTSTSSHQLVQLCMPVLALRHRLDSSAHRYLWNSLSMALSSCGPLSASRSAALTLPVQGIMRLR